MGGLWLEGLHSCYGYGQKDKPGCLGRKQRLDVHEATRGVTSLQEEASDLPVHLLNALGFAHFQLKEVEEAKVSGGPCGPWLG